MLKEVECRWPMAGATRELTSASPCCWLWREKNKTRQQTHKEGEKELTKGVMVERNRRAKLTRRSSRKPDVFITHSLTWTCIHVAENTISHPWWPGATYCKFRIFCVHVIFVYFVRGGFRTKIKCMQKVQSKSENPQRSATVRKFHTHEVGEPRIRKLSAYEIFWIYSTHGAVTRRQTFNPAKSAVVDFRGKRKKQGDCSASPSFGTMSVPVCEKVKHLGIQLTSTLSWTPHVDSLLHRVTHVSQGFHLEASSLPLQGQ